MNQILKLDFHMASHTGASTKWYIIYDNKKYNIREAEEAGLIKVLHSTNTSEKTHWYKFIEVLNPNITLKRVRISNRGNLTVSTYRPDEVPEEYRATQEEIEALEVIR
jgi:hypothetical protein